MSRLLKSIISLVFWLSVAKSNGNQRQNTQKTGHCQPSVIAEYVLGAIATEKAQHIAGYGTTQHKAGHTWNETDSRNKQQRENKKILRHRKFLNKKRKRKYAVLCLVIG
mgnify:CR=1 FL=1